MTELHELYGEYDALWEQLKTRPRDERKAARDSGYSDDSKASRLYRRTAGLMQEIRQRQRDLEADLAALLGEAMKTDKELSAEVYAGLCNVRWEHEDGSRFACSWRAAGEIVAEIRTGKDGDEDYLTWYCTGGEGHVSQRVSDALAALGWTWSV